MGAAREGFLGVRMATEKVLSDEILEDARRKADRAVSRAKREAEKILATATAGAEAETEKALTAARQRGERAAKAILSTIEQEVRRDLLEAQEAELQGLFQAARRRLADRKSCDYPAVLAGLAAQAIGAMATDKVTLELGPADQAIATEPWLAEVRRRVGRDVAIAVSPEAAAIDAGLIVRSADGRLLYDDSLDARLKRLAPDLRRQLAAEVFAQKEPPESAIRNP